MPIATIFRILGALDRVKPQPPGRRCRPLEAAQAGGRPAVGRKGPSVSARGEGEAHGPGRAKRRRKQFRRGKKYEKMSPVAKRKTVTFPVETSLKGVWRGWEQSGDER